jgi:hypothetical protein
MGSADVNNLGRDARLRRSWRGAWPNPPIFAADPHPSSQQQAWRAPSMSRTFAQAGGVYSVPVGWGGG